MNHAYIAGIVDGEGSICLARACVKNKHRGTGARPSVFYRPTIAVYNNERRLLEAVRRRMGVGGIYRMPVKNPRARPSFVLFVVGVDLAPKFLRPLMPHLFLKARQAKVMLQFCKRRTRRGRNPYGPADLALVEKMRALNNRLPSKGSMRPVSVDA